MASFDQLVISFLVDEVAGGFFADVPPGHVATVYDRLRGVLNKTWGPGLHFKLPFIQKAKIFNAQTLEYTISEGFNPGTNPESLADDAITAFKQYKNEVESSQYPSGEQSYHMKKGEFERLKGLL